MLDHEFNSNQISPQAARIKGFMIIAVALGLMTVIASFL